jgi:L-seryl-tRNA(Ser) seleniumtransferase
MMDTGWRQKYLRNIPAVDELVAGCQADGKAYPHALLVRLAQEAAESLRRQIMAAEREEELKDIKISPQEMIQQVQGRLRQLEQPSLRRVINATGTILHTNLGRAPLARQAAAAAKQASGYCNLELELKSGKRGLRYSHVERLLTILTGAEAACVVNNNAAAVLLALNTLAAGKKVLVSRGELVEIGGSFRVPEVMAAGGAQLVEVGTTNKTHIADYRQALDEDTALLLKVHTSNYRIVGFTASAGIAELAELASAHGIPLMEDLGSGLLLDLSPFGMEREPLVFERIAAGVDVLTLSGDKLLGGPQAGIILGKRKYLDRIKKNQLMRALRPDKITLAALEATLRIYLFGNPLQEIPVLYMLTASLAELERRALRLAAAVREMAGERLDVEVRQDVSVVGGGAMPLTDLPTFVVAVRPKELSVSEWAFGLRTGNPSLVGRLQEDWLLLDLRTIAESEEEEVVLCLS